MCNETEFGRSMSFESKHPCSKYTTSINYKDFTKKLESKKSFNILDFKDAVVDFEQLILNLIRENWLQSMLKTTDL